MTRLMDTAKPMASDEAQIMTLMAYDISFNICDHQNPSTGPLAVVEMHQAEQYRNESGLYRAMDRHHRQGVYKHFGLSLLEYLSLPPEVIEMITDISLARAREEAAVADDVEHDVETARHDRKSNGTPR